METNGTLLTGQWFSAVKELGTPVAGYTFDAEITFTADSYTVIYKSHSGAGAPLLRILPKYKTDSVNTDAYPQGVWQTTMYTQGLEPNSYITLTPLENRVLESVSVQIRDPYSDNIDSNIISANAPITKVVNDTNLNEAIQGLKTYIDTADALKGNANFYYWDGLSSTDNPANLALWQEIMTRGQTEEIIVVVGGNMVFTNFIRVAPDTASTQSTGTKAILGTSYQPTSNKTIKSKGTNLLMQSIKVTLSISSVDPLTVSSVNAVGTNTISMGYFLPTDNGMNYTFTPTEDGHPATKKYVDDSVSAITIPNASADTVGGVKTYLDSATGTLYITTDGSTPGPTTSA